MVSMEFDFFAKLGRVIDRCLLLHYSAVGPFKILVMILVKHKKHAQYKNLVMTQLRNHANALKY